MVLKRAQYFITCNGRMLPGLRVSPQGVYRRLAGLERAALPGAGESFEQLTLFDQEVG